MTEHFTTGQAFDALLEAERELFAWATGKRSYTNEQMQVENYVDYANGTSAPNRGETLVRIAQRDAAETENARQRVLALRLLTGVTPEGNDPRHT